MEDKENWLIDEEAARVVRKIFNLCMAEYGPVQIAKRLWKETAIPDKKSTSANSDRLIHPNHLSYRFWTAKLPADTFYYQEIRATGG